MEVELRRRLQAQGRLTFAEFMEVALYLPGGGYYQAHAALGRRGDFLTSPETHPVFGALLARLLWLMWRGLGQPDDFHVIEYGAGTGALCRQVLTTAPALGAGFGGALRYEIVEVSDLLRRAQQSALADLSDRAAWLDPAAPPHPRPGCVLANEVVDALPCHRLRMGGGGPQEVYVGLEADRYFDLPGPPSKAELEAYVRGLPVAPAEGSLIEVNLAAGEWLREAARRVAPGYLVTIDFGGPASEVYGRAGPRGGLKCFWRHGWTDDPYQRPGLQDITAPVDFTHLRRVGEEIGLAAVEEGSQAELMARLGLEQSLGILDSMDLPVEERERNRAAMEWLADPAGLGSYRVLVQGREARPLRFELLAEVGREGAPLLARPALEWPE